MEILKNFQIHKTSLKEIDDIFSNIIRKPQYNYISGVMNILDILHRGFRIMLQTIQEHVRIFVFNINLYLIFYIY